MKMRRGWLGCIVAASLGLIIREVKNECVVREFDGEES